MAMLFSLVSCGWTTQKEPSVLVIAVENLNYEDFPCDQGNLEGGFEDFCRNAIRFTHAYTPSIMSQSALVSLLTGSYPIDHGIRHNGNQFLPERVDSIAEVFVGKGYRTAFFTGGPPIFRKSGLAQGFEFFDDQINLGPDKLYRVAEESVQLFLSWLSRDVGQDDFFSVLYLPDLQFIDVATKDKDGNSRSRGFDGQLREIDEALQSLITGLRQRGHYDNTIIVLAGLNGRSTKDRTEELQNTSLLSSNTQVALFIKPNHQSRDLGINWKVDTNVSLVDIGHTLYDIAGRDFKVANAVFPSVSLKAIFDNPYPSWSRKRSLLIETGWPEWRGFADIRFSIRKDQFLVLLDKETKIFNSLIDRYEASPVNPSDKLWASIYADIQPELNYLKFPRWSGIDPGRLTRLKISENLFRKDRVYEGFEAELDGLLKEQPNDIQYNSWKTALSFEKRNWQDVKIHALKTKNALLTFVAQYHLAEIFKGDLKGCGVFFRGRPIDLRAPHQCRDETFLSLLRWQRADEHVKLDLQERFLRAYVSDKLSERLTKLNFFGNLTWLVGQDLSNTPNTTDLYLTLPQAKRERAIVSQRLKKYFPEIN